MDNAQTNGRNWSPQQAAIFDWFAQGLGNLVVRARAGTGKTTTILEAVGRAPEQNALLAAFNKRIADELTTKLRAPNAQAKTLHSVGFGLVRRYWSSTKVEAARSGRLAQAAAGQDAPDQMIALVKRLAGYGKNMIPALALGRTDACRPSEDDGHNCYCHRWCGVASLMEIAQRMDCEPDDEWEDNGWGLYRIAKCAQRAMELACHKDGEVDFDDMIFLPLALKLARPAYDMVVVDEAQDMNAAQILLAQRVCSGRIAVVGDDRQAIYGFRGADSGSIDRLKRELGAVEMPLTITYRCPKLVVALAAAIVPDYAAAPSAPDGVVSTAKHTQVADLASAGDFVLSRKNAPLPGLCLALLRRGKRAKIEGKDVGKGLSAIVKKLKAKSIPDLLSKLGKWEAREVKRANKTPKYAEAKIAKVADEADTIRELAEGLSGPAELMARIESLFADTDGAPDYIVCSSVHRAKGLETDRVFLLVDTLYPGKRIDTEERNIHYVAITRAKRELVLVTGTPGGTDRGAKSVPAARVEPEPPSLLDGVDEEGEQRAQDGPPAGADAVA